MSLRRSGQTPGEADNLTNEIMAGHPDYNSRPKRDTTNSNDNVLPRTGQDQYSLATALLADGVLQAYKTIAIRTTSPPTLQGRV